MRVRHSILQLCRYKKNITAAKGSRPIKKLVIANPHEEMLYLGENAKGTIQVKRLYDEAELISLIKTSVYWLLRMVRRVLWYNA